MTRIKRHIDCMLMSTILLLVVNNAFGQDPNYSIYWNDRTYLNPALCGSNNGLYLFAHKRIQWHNIVSPLNTFSVGADVKMPCIGGGIGFRFMTNVEGEGYQSTTSGDLMFSQIFPIKKKRSELSFGLSAGFVNRKIDPSKLIFSDQIDPVNSGLTPTTASFGDLDSDFKLNFNAGVSYRTYLPHSDHSYFSGGFSVRNLTEPELSLISQDSKLPMKLTAYVEFHLKRGVQSGRTGHDFNPILIASTQHQPGKTFSNNAFRYVATGLSYHEKTTSFSLLYKNENFIPTQIESIILAFGLHFPVKNNNCNFYFSYDFTTSSLQHSETDGVVEFGLNFLFGNCIPCKISGSSGKQRIKHCPDFGGPGMMPKNF